MTSVNEERVPVRQWQALYRTGAFYTSEYSAMEKAGWYNWNCSSESLAERLKNLANVVMGVTHPFILDHYFILCRNLSSRFGKLYNEVGFVPLVEEEQRKCFWITLDDPYHRKKWSLFTGRYGDDAPEFACGDIQTLLQYINRIASELEQDLMVPFVQEKRAAARYAHRFRGEPGEVRIYRNGEHQYSYRSKLDGQEHTIIVTADLKDTPPSFILGQVERYRELYVFGAELSIPEKTPVRPKTVQRGGRER